PGAPAGSGSGPARAPATRQSRARANRASADRVASSSPARLGSVHRRVLLLVRQIQRRERLLPFRGFAGEEAGEGLVVLVGGRRGQGARGSLRRLGCENGRDFLR